MSAGALRAWLGWRTAGSGWNGFVRNLRMVFVPATWLVMRRYGLQAYVPTVLRQDKPDHLPDEIALLRYESEAAYEGHKKAVAGRGYGLMHSAIFDFAQGPRRSRSDWAEKEDRPDAKVRAYRRDRTGDGLAFDDKGATAIVVVLDGPPAAASAQDVFATLGHTACEAVAICEPKLTVAWLAAPEGTDAQAIADGLRTRLGLEKGNLVVAHAATPASLPHTDPGEAIEDNQLPALAQDQSLHFKP